MTYVHTYPVNDLIEHWTDGRSCPCGPTIEAVFREDGSNGWLVSHHSLDGREQSEVCGCSEECCGGRTACCFCGRPRVVSPPGVQS